MAQVPRTAQETINKLGVLGSVQVRSLIVEVYKSLDLDKQLREVVAALAQFQANASHPGSGLLRQAFDRIREVETRQLETAATICNILVDFPLEGILRQLRERNLSAAWIGTEL